MSLDLNDREELILEILKLKRSLASYKSANTKLRKKIEVLSRFKYRFKKAVRERDIAKVNLKVFKSKAQLKL